MESLVKTQLENRKQEPLLKPHSSGWVQRVFVVGTAVVTVYTLGFTAPFITIPVLAIAVLFGAQEIKNVQDPRTAERLGNLLNSSTPRHPSIKESEKALKQLFHTRDINAAIEHMMDHCEWVVIKNDPRHPLRGFGEVYAYVDPWDEEILMPLEGMFKLFKQWGVEPAVDAAASTVDAAAADAAEALEAEDEPLPQPSGEVEALAEQGQSLAAAAASLGIASPPTIAFDNDDSYPDTWQNEEAAPDNAAQKPLSFWIGDQPNPEILKLPIDDRARMIVERLIADGFAIDKIMAGSVIVVAGDQRGGKGTLLSILCILQQALTQGETAIRYYTAGTDVYPIKTLKTICASSFPQAPSKDLANTAVAHALAEEIKRYEKYENYECQGEMLVIDEAIALAQVTSPERNREQASYLIRQFAKTGATCIIVLHASNLTAWVGSGNTGGLAQAFSSGVALIGCRSKPMATNGLQMTNVATGEYFFADPKNFGTPLKGEPELGKIPDWLLVRKHPGNGAPDPSRSMLAFFPEMVSSSVTAIQPPTIAQPSTPAAEPAKEDAYVATETDLQIDFEKALEFIEDQLPYVGTCLTVRGLARTAGASALGITRDNAEQLMQRLAGQKSDLFRMGEKTFNTGKTSRYIERLTYHYPVQASSQTNGNPNAFRA